MKVCLRFLLMFGLLSAAAAITSAQEIAKSVAQNSTPTNSVSGSGDDKNKADAAIDAADPLVRLLIS